MPLRKCPLATPRLLLVATIAGVLMAATCSAADPKPPSNPAETPITLLVRDGRQLKGFVDHRTDDETLWIRVSRGSVYLSMGLTWDLVQEVRAGGERLSAASFRPLAKSYASRSPKLSSLTSAENNNASVVSHPNIVSPLNRVYSLEIIAEPANWDRDPESDGIALRILPLGIDRRVLAVDGVIAVQLTGREFVTDRHDQGFPMLGQWSQRVRSVDFRGQEGAVYHLPANRQLDHDTTVLSIGMIRAQLHVMGQGQFEAVTPTRLRNYNPIREQLDEHDRRYDSFGRYRARHW
jgi:hypothetical protein